MTNSPKVVEPNPKWSTWWEENNFILVLWGGHKKLLNVSSSLWQKRGHQWGSLHYEIILINGLNKRAHVITIKMKYKCMCWISQVTSIYTNKKENTTSVISNQIDFASSQYSAYAPKRILFPLIVYCVACHENYILMFFSKFLKSPKSAFLNSIISNVLWFWNLIILINKCFLACEYNILKLVVNVFQYHIKF